jgi:hypothetical protein
MLDLAAMILCRQKKTIVADLPQKLIAKLDLGISLHPPMHV